MKLKGTLTSTFEFIVSSTGIKDGSTIILTKSLPDLGDLEKLYLRNIGFDNYQCKRITVEQEFSYWVFDCDE